MMDRRKQLMAGGGIAVAAILGVGVLAGSVGVFGLSDDPPRVGKLSPIDSTRRRPRSTTAGLGRRHAASSTTPGATVGTTPNTTPNTVPSTIAEHHAQHARLASDHHRDHAGLRRPRRGRRRRQRARLVELGR